MSNFERIANRERHERSLGYIEAFGIFAVFGLIVAAWILYL